MYISVIVALLLLAAYGLGIFVGYIVRQIHEDDEGKDAELEIIRCEDCKWCEEHYDIDGIPYWVCKNWVGSTDADGFCHEAERITDE